MPGPPDPRGSRSGDPLAAVRRLVVDVNNVLGALPRSRTGLSGPTLLGRLRAIVPTGATVELVFDGPPTPGGRHPGPGLVARFAAPRTADEVIIDLVRLAGPPAPGDDPAILVVTDDTDLRRAARDLGAATAGTAWLIRRAERTTTGSPSVGRPRPPLAGPAEDADRPRWRPGRGATAKRGNPRRAPRRRTDDGRGRGP
jgi:hypothetical protein